MAASPARVPFAVLTAQTIALAREYGFEPRQIDAPFDHAVSELPSGSLELTTQSHIARGVGELRAMNLSSGKVDVVTMFLLPVTERALPLYAMQLVSLGGQPIVAVLDARNLYPDELPSRASALLDEAKARFPLSRSEDIPEWYRECRSGHEIFSRPEACEGFDGYCQAHLWLARGLLSEYAASRRVLPAIDAADHRERCRAYLGHHAANSAGKPLMSRAFGEAFTQRYLDDCLFQGDSAA
jgi:hypothetical protein